MFCRWCWQKEGADTDPLLLCPDCRKLWDETKAARRAAFGHPDGHPNVVTWLDADRKLKAACRPFGDIDLLDASAAAGPPGVSPALDG